MVDTIIANLSEHQFRTITRGLLAASAPGVTDMFKRVTLQQISDLPRSVPQFFPKGIVADEFYEWQKTYRCIMGCGNGLDAVKRITEMILQLATVIPTSQNSSLPPSLERLSLGNLVASETVEILHTLTEPLVTVNNDLVQCITAIENELLSEGHRKLTEVEKQILEGLRKNLVEISEVWDPSQDFVLQLGLSGVCRLLGKPLPELPAICPSRNTDQRGEALTRKHLPTFKLGKATVPRVFMGLWQFSSPLWGSAKFSDIDRDFRKHFDAGFTAYGQLFQRFFSPS